MKRFLIGLVAGIGLLAVPAGEAAAQSAVEAATKWGLLGKWAIDCSIKPGSNSVHYVYMRQNNALVLKRDFGPQSSSDTSEVISAILTSDGGIELATYFKQLTTPAVRTQRLIREGSGFRTLFNRDQHDVYTVRDFKFLHNGEPLKTFQLCSR